MRRAAHLPYTTVDLREVTGKCDDCQFKRDHTVGFAPFEIVGSELSPDILFVGESPSFNELQQERPFCGRAGTFLRRAIEKFTPNYALANITCCHPISGGIRTPAEEDCQYCIPHLERFIEQLNPKRVVLLGRTAYNHLLPKSYIGSKSITELTQTCPYDKNGVLYSVSFHPSFIVRIGGEKSKRYEAYINSLRLEKR